MSFSRKIEVLFFVIAFFIAGCKNRDKVGDKTIYDNLYLDYTVTAEEGDEFVTCVFQFKNNGPEGKAINIEPAKVKLDGQPIEADSAKLSGTFYEVQKPVDSFSGKHTIAFITPDGRQYVNTYAFSPFTLQQELSEKNRRKPFSIQLKNFPPAEKTVRLLLLDTAFETWGFNDLVPVVNGKINIDEPVLKAIKNGPINLELYMEQEFPLKQTTKAGGRILINYGLKREFELVE